MLDFFLSSTDSLSYFDILTKKSERQLLLYLCVFIYIYDDDDEGDVIIKVVKILLLLLLFCEYTHTHIILKHHCMNVHDLFHSCSPFLLGTQLLKRERDRERERERERQCLDCIIKQ